MMSSESLKLLYTPKDYIIFLTLLFCIFSFNLSKEYLKFSNLKSEEIYEVNAKVINIYPKDKIDTVKLQTNDFEFFSSVSKNSFKKDEFIRVLVVTKNITFFNYLRGFYAPVFNEFKIKDNLKNNYTIKKNLKEFIDTQHENTLIKELYNALFLALPISTILRDSCATYGISHLFALSGFHLGIISIISYFIFNILYSYFHKTYFPYRNKRVDSTIFISIILFSYLIFIDIIPSFLRAFIMSVTAFYFLRRNIKVFSFETLLFVLLFIIAFFPKYLFSISLWFSICGVFYIFLFIKYFKDISKYQQILLFNFWIYLAMLPISHYLFGITSYVELISPIITLLFTIFYPLAIVLHLLGVGDLFDNLLVFWINYDVKSWIINSNIFFVLIYTAVSLLSIFNKVPFYILNLMMMIFGIYIYII